MRSCTPLPERALNVPMRRLSRNRRVGFILFLAFVLRGCSSVGRAGALQASGQKFDSSHLHQFASVAQKVEQEFCKLQVVGSIPTAGTTKALPPKTERSLLT